MDTPPDLKEAVTHVRYSTLNERANDHEARLRMLEEVATQFKLLMYLSFGGGALTFINTMALFIVIAMMVLNGF